MSTVVLRTRQVVWGGGEVMLQAVAEELRRRGTTVVLEAPAGSEVGRRVAADPRGGRPDLLVANDFRSLWRGALRHPLTPRAFVVHGWWQTSRARDLVVRLLRARALCVSTAVADAVVRNGVLPAGRVQVLPVGPDREVFRPVRPAERAAARAELGITDDRLVCAWIGRPQPEKGLPRFVAAVAEAGVCGVVVTSAAGADPAEQRELASLDGSGALRLPPDQAALALRAADVFVSTSEFESLGIAHLEALACGVPVVSTARGGPRDVLGDGRAGLHLPDAPAPALVEVLRDLDADRTQLARLAAAAPAAVAGRSTGAVVDLLLGTAS